MDEANRTALFAMLSLPEDAPDRPPARKRIDVNCLGFDGPALLLIHGKDRSSRTLQRCGGGYRVLRKQIGGR
jgi:hypothetical protein